MKKIIYLLTGSFLSLMLYACATTAFTGRKQLLLYPDSTISSLSADSYKEYMSTATLSSNKSYTSLVQTVGSKMVTALAAYLKAQGQDSYLNGLDWDFNVVKDSSVNAFCLPNGKIVLYEGIMKYCNTADYVAVVIGHEMGHAVARHGNERMSQQNLIASTGEIARSVYSSTAGADASKLAVFDAVFGVGSNVAIVLPYSRKHEYEADQIGLYIMSLAGYNVYQAPKFWQYMMGNKQASSFDLLSTHPSDAKRIANINTVIGQMEQVNKK